MMPPQLIKGASFNGIQKTFLRANCFESKHA